VEILTKVGKKEIATWRNCKNGRSKKLGKISTFAKRTGAERPN
jgi:hypothetical protein